MKIKCSFIYENNEYDQFDSLKNDNPQIKSRKQLEANFVREIEVMLKQNLEPNTYSELKAKIIERKGKE